jgi:hypothetical protein
MNYLVFDRKPLFFGQKFEIRHEVKLALTTKSETMTEIEMLQ